jgi:hypothetical protein
LLSNIEDKVGDTCVMQITQALEKMFKRGHVHIDAIRNDLISQLESPQSR